MASALLLQGDLILCCLSPCLISASVGRWAGAAQKMFYASCVWFGLCSLPAFSNALAWPLKKNVATCLPGSCPPVGAIVVLGGGGGTGAGSRIAAGVELYRHGLADWLILSGGGPGKTPEAVVMCRAAVTYGVPEKKIGIEIASRNTRENAMFTAAILRSGGVKKILLVTSNLHMTRARYDFLRHGIDVESAAIDVSPPMDLRGWKYWTPSFYYFRYSMQVTKEYIGIVIYFMKNLSPLSDA